MLCGLIGNKLIDELFILSAEQNMLVTMLDKLHTLEKYGIINDAAIWLKMCEVCNYLAHKYPSHPELTAQFVNELYKLAL